MPTPPLSDEKCQEAVDALAEHGSINAAAARIKPDGINRSTLEGRLREARRRGFVSKVPPKLIIKGQSILHNDAGEEVARWDKTKLAGRDPDDAVQLPDPKKITKVSTLYDQQGNVSLQWVAERPEDAQREALWRLFSEEMARDVPRAKPEKTTRRAAEYEDRLVGFPLGDHHMGMLAWAEETGGASYDIAIGEHLLRAASDRLMMAAPPCTQALIAVLGDFLHYDSLSAVTPMNKNLLDSDGRFAKMVRAAIRGIRYTIEAAKRRHLNVHVIFEPGNHDPASTVWLRELVAAIYENEPRVTVDVTPGDYHYYEWGLNLIGTHHGHGAKLESLPGIMAHDRPEAWGRTRHRFIWTGHLHHKRVIDVLGVQCEILRVLAPGDAWSAGKGHRSIRSMQAILIDREYGEVERHTVNPAMFNAKVAA